MKLKVIELSRVLAGPLCGMILGDLGADVIKVERPGAGDETRGYGPPFDEWGTSAYFLSLNRNKKSIALDLKMDRDRRVFLDLLKGADVVIDNYLPGRLEAFEINPELLVESHPALIWCTISGFSPESGRPAYDFVIQAESGWMSITGEPDGAPMKTGVALADIIAGKDAVIAILSRALERSAGELPPSRRRLRLSLLDSAVAALANVAQNVLVTGRDAKRWGNAHVNLVPYQLFDAVDRAIVLAVGSDAQWISCAGALGLPELAADEKLRSNAGRVAQRIRVVAALADRIVTRSASEWIELLEAAGVPCGIVKTVSEALEDSEASPETGVPSPFGGRARLAPPLLDADGDALRNLGWRAFDVR